MRYFHLEIVQRRWALRSLAGIVLLCRHNEGDEVALSGMIEENKKAGLVPDLEFEVLDCEHRSMYDREKGGGCERTACVSWRV